MHIDRVLAIVLAGGSGTRFGAGGNKVLVELGGRPVLWHSLAAFEAHPDVDDLVLVVRDEDRPALDALDLPRGKLRATVAGGDTRQASEWAGIQAAAALVDPAHRPSTAGLLHDAARPLVRAAVVDRLLASLRDHGGGAIPGIRVEDDLLDLDGRGVRTTDLVAVQTPQAFPLDVLLRTYPVAAERGVDGVDTADTVTAVDPDVGVRWVEGDRATLKITHPEDLAAAEGHLHPGST